MLDNLEDWSFILVFPEPFPFCPRQARRTGSFISFFIFFFRTSAYSGAKQEYHMPVTIGVDTVDMYNNSPRNGTETYKSSSHKPPI